MSKRDYSTRRPRNIPHPSPDPDGELIVKRHRKEATLHGSRSRTPVADDVAAVEDRPARIEPGRHNRGTNPSTGLPRTRVPGTNGSWPARGQDPKPPAFCALYDDLNEQQLFDDADAIGRGERPVPVFGQYPKGFLRLILPWLRCERSRILHVCSGSLPPGEGIRVDIRPEAKPDILADGRNLPLPDSSHDGAVLIDPPYTKQYARDLYGIEYPLPAHLLAEAARVIAPGGRIGFVHYLVPMPPPGCHFVKMKALSTGFGFQVRAVTIFEKDPPGLPFPGRRPEAP